MREVKLSIYQGDTTLVQTTCPIKIENITTVRDLTGYEMHFVCVRHRGDGTEVFHKKASNFGTDGKVQFTIEAEDTFFLEPGQYAIEIWGYKGDIFFTSLQGKLIVNKSYKINADTEQHSI